MPNTFVIERFYKAVQTAHIRTTRAIPSVTYIRLRHLPIFLQLIRSLLSRTQYFLPLSIERGLKVKIRIFIHALLFLQLLKIKVQLLTTVFVDITVSERYYTIYLLIG